MQEIQRGVLDRVMVTSVWFNGVLVPASPQSALTGALGRYVQNLIVWNHHETYKVSLVGSAVPIKFSDRYFLLCTSHQLNGCRPEDVSLLGRDGVHLITSSGVRRFENECHPGYLDLAAFKFTEPCEAQPELKARFYELRDIPPDAPNTDIVFALVAGFPCNEQDYDLEERNHIGTLKHLVVCHLDPGSYDPARLLCLRSKQPFDFDPDGMSGGSAFVVQKIDGEFRAFFAGIVATAGTDKFHIIKVGLIYRFLRALVQMKSGDA
jgi:hypothetical protein